MKKSLLITIAAVSLLLASCAPAKKNYIIATGGTSGTYYPFGGALAVPSFRLPFTFRPLCKRERLAASKILTLPFFLPLPRRLFRTIGRPNMKAYISRMS